MSQQADPANHPHPYSQSLEEHDHDHDHGEHHAIQGKGIRGWLSALFHVHGHGHQHGALVTERTFLDNQEGIRTVWLALAALAITSLLQIVIVVWSRSVALFADTTHNIGDGLNSIPLLIAFYLARRAATRRYTYGYGKAEDVAGIFIILSIAISAGVVFYESFRKLINPEAMSNLGWVAAAAVIGFLGNEAVALLQIRTGRRIGSAALEADGLHARTDGYTSLAVLLAAVGTWAGFPILDPLIGLLIGIVILFITRDAVVKMWYRLMDAIEPEYIEQAEEIITQNPEVKALTRLRMRWIGHRLHAELHLAVDPHLSTLESHRIVEEVRHELFHHFHMLTEVVVHVDPWSEKPEAIHENTLHHEPVPSSLLRSTVGGQQSGS